MTRLQKSCYIAGYLQNETVNVNKPARVRKLYLVGLLVLPSMDGAEAVEPWVWLRCHILFSEFLKGVVCLLKVRQPHATKNMVSLGELDVHVGRYFNSVTPWV